MKRTIKFRGWLKDHWCRSEDCISKDDYADMEYNITDTILMESESFDSGDIKFMQCFDIVDMNGIELYEEDLVYLCEAPEYKRSSILYRAEFDLMSIPRFVDDESGIAITFEQYFLKVGGALNNNVFEIVGDKHQGFNMNDRESIV